MIITNVLLFCLVIIEGFNMILRIVKLSNEFDREPPLDEDIMRRLYS